MSQSVDASIYIGHWINWSHGRYLGSTITLSERDGGLLTAFLALFVTSAGSACWGILSYVIHQYRVRQYYQDGLHHQKQAILRNTGHPAAAAWKFFQLAWYWRKHAVMPLTRTLPLALLALTNLTLFGIAGLFSSEVMKAAGNETLIRSSNCGFLNLTATETIYDNAEETIDTNDTLAAYTYSRACYDNAQNLLQCNQYVRQRLHWQSNQNASCPFPSDLCLYGATGAFEMDSGLIDTHEALGINAPMSERIQYRKVTACSPIQTAGYLNKTVLQDSTIERYMYGPIFNSSNYTYQYELNHQEDNHQYTLTSFIAYAGDDSGSWTPIAPLNRTDADVSLFLLAANSVDYEAPVYDPFYATSLDAPSGYYFADNNINALACTDQYQFCNPNSGQCTPLTSSIAFSNLPDITLNDAQAETASLIMDFIFYLSTCYSVESRGASALRASETVYGGIQVAQLPDTQWMTDVSDWFAVSMAKLQQKTVQHATGPAYVPSGWALVKPRNKAEQNLCNNQKVRSQSGTTSFSVVGLAIILAVGGLLILAHLFLDILMEYIRRKWQWNEYKSLQWTLDGKFQLQRLAFEEAGQGTWSGGTSFVPVTKKGNRIGVPRGVDVRHPRLSRAWRQSGTDVGVDSEAQSLMSGKGMNYQVELTRM